MSIIIPLRFTRKYPLSARLIRESCETQVQADRMLKSRWPKDWPEYRGTYDRNSREGRRTRERNRRAQMGGTYSLEQCQGGAKYHQPSAPRPDPVWNAPKLTARVAVSSDHAPAPVATPRKRAPKSYLKHPFTGEPETVRYTDTSTPTCKRCEEHAAG